MEFVFIFWDYDCIISVAIYFALMFTSTSSTCGFISFMISGIMWLRKIELLLSPCCIINDSLMFYEDLCFFLYICCFCCSFLEWTRFGLYPFRLVPVSCEVVWPYQILLLNLKCSWTSFCYTSWPFLVFSCGWIFCLW